MRLSRIKNRRKIDKNGYYFFEFFKYLVLIYRKIVLILKIILHFTFNQSAEIVKSRITASVEFISIR